MIEDVEEQRAVLALAAQAGLSSTYDASRSSYADWRSKVLTFAQLLQEKTLGRTATTQPVVDCRHHNQLESA